MKLSLASAIKSSISNLFSVTWDANKMSYFRAFLVLKRIYIKKSFVSCSNQQISRKYLPKNYAIKLKEFNPDKWDIEFVAQRKEINPGMCSDRNSLRVISTSSSSPTAPSLHHAIGIVGRNWRHQPYGRPTRRVIKCILPSYPVMISYIYG